jgi:hypothetical protein
MDVVMLDRWYAVVHCVMIAHVIMDCGDELFVWTTSENPVPRFPVGLAIRDYE